MANDEQRDTPSSLKERQIRMEQQVYRIWTVLSAFEESSAACISDMLRQVSNGQYLDAIRMAEKFILHVEVLFATMTTSNTISCDLTRKETGARRMGMTQELLALVTGLAHYLKILIRIALTGALKLEREQSVNEAMSGFLDKLHLLAVQGGNPSARRLLKGSNGELLHSNGGNIGTQGVAYGFGSLAPENAGESPFSNTGASKLSPTKPPSDLCVKCGVTVEEDCVRLGTYQRWHSNCVSCATCGKVATAPMVKEPKGTDEKDKDGQPPKLSTARRPPANPNCRSGFQAVQRLEQYAFLLNVALRRLYLLLKKQGVVPLSPDVSVTNHASPYSDTMEASDPYRNNNDIMRMKSVHLDRKLSATAHLPKRSTIVESPAGRTAHPHDVLKPQKSQELGVAQSQRSAANIPLLTTARKGKSITTTTMHFNLESARPQLGRLPIDSTQGGQVLRPSFARNNTEVMIVDDSTPNSPAGGAEDALLTSVPDDGITLADIPQIMERAQAREQHRPRQHAVPFVADLNALELTIIKHTAVLVLSRSPLKDQFDLDDILESLENKKGGFWNKFLFKANDKKIKKKGVFGVPLELLVEREGADSLLGASRATLRVPSFIDDVISAMRQMGLSSSSYRHSLLINSSDMSVEGIFRKNGNIRHLKDLTEAIDRDPSSVDLSSDHPVQLAALLKKFLRDLPDPLLTFKLHRLLVVTQSKSEYPSPKFSAQTIRIALPQEADRRRYLHLVSLLLPKSHRDTMEVLFVFLKWVASFAHMDEETGSKMDLGNLATVICPSILYPRGRDPRDESFGPFGAIRVVTALLEDQDLFLTVPEDFLDIINDKEYFASAVDLPGKDFMRKCDTWLRSKGRAGASSGPPHNQRPLQAHHIQSVPTWSFGQ
ncbi:LIM-domain-containing protein [Salix suchowensis]|nr:LIM-domain-containing protein [Salix suchowensis]